MADISVAGISSGRQPPSAAVAQRTPSAAVAQRPRKADRELLADRAYRELRDRIVTLQLPPGSPIDEDELGRELEIGRTPIREAIKRLAVERLVVVFPRRGTFVSEINITDLAHISDVRVQLEGHAAARAAERITPARRRELDALLNDLQRAAASGDHSTLMALDTRVHRFIYDCAANPYLAETLTTYLNLSLRIWYVVLERLPHLLARVHEHEQALKAIAAGDAARAREVMVEHVTTFEREVRAVL